MHYQWIKTTPGIIKSELDEVSMRTCCVNPVNITTLTHSDSCAHLLDQLYPGSVGQDILFQWGLTPLGCIKTVRSGQAANLSGHRNAVFEPGESLWKTRREHEHITLIAAYSLYRQWSSSDKVNRRRLIQWFRQFDICMLLS